MGVAVLLHRGQMTRKFKTCCIHVPIVLVHCIILVVNFAFRAVRRCSPLRSTVYLKAGQLFLQLPDFFFNHFLLFLLLLFLALTILPILVFVLDSKHAPRNVVFEVDDILKEPTFLLIFPFAPTDRVVQFGIAAKRTTCVRANLN